MIAGPRTEPADPPGARGRVFVDVELVAISPEEPTRLSPGVAEALAHLVEGSREVALLGRLPAELTDLLRGQLGREVRAVDELPAGTGRNDWYLTGEPDRCRETRVTGIRTILVGPRRSPGRAPAARCDVEARDLLAAVIEVLARDAMSELT